MVSLLAVWGAGCCCRPAVKVVGPEFQVNTYTTGDQIGRFTRSVALTLGGESLVVWEGKAGQDGYGSGVFGQRYDSAGVPQGGEFQVNKHTMGDQKYPAVGACEGGGFVVVWMSRDRDGSGIFGQQFDGNGNALHVTEFQVNSYTTRDQVEPDVACGPGGDFVVVWRSPQGRGGDDVRGQRFNSNGNKVGNEFTVNSHTEYNQALPAVEVDDAGGFVVVWYEDQGRDGEDQGTFGRRFDNAGNALGEDFPINTSTAGAQSAPAVAMKDDGKFVVVWEDREGADGSGHGVFGQRFDSAGAKLGPEFQVNTYVTKDQNVTAVASVDCGYLVVWNSKNGQDGDGSGVFGQAFHDRGGKSGSEFQINSYTPGDQGGPAVATDGHGRGVVVWGSTPNQDGHEFGVFGQRLVAEKKRRWCWPWCCLW